MIWLAVLTIFAALLLQINLLSQRIDRINKREEKYMTIIDSHQKSISIIQDAIIQEIQSKL